MVEFPEQWLEIGYYSAYAGSVTLSVGANATIMWIVFWHKQLHTGQHFLSLSISIADTMFSVCTVMFYFLTNYNYSISSFGTNYCSFSDYVYFATLIIRGVALIGLGWDRYITNVKPEYDSNLHKRVLKGILGATWMLAIMVPLTMVLFSQFNDTRITCYILWPHELIYYRQDEFVINAIFIMLVYVIPSILLCVLGVKTLYAQIKDQKNQSITGLLREFSGEKKDAKMIYLMTFLFIVSHFPYYSLYIYVYYIPTILYYECYIHLYMLSFLGLINTCLFFPIVYLFFNSSFRIIYNWERGFQIMFLDDMYHQSPLVHAESEL